jgi:hypothetical protein
MDGMETLPARTPTHAMVDEVDRKSHTGYRGVPEFEAAGLSELKFRHLWGSGRPFVVKDAMPLMSPEAFLSGTDGENTCTVSVLDGDEWIDTPSTLQKFFQSWKNGSNVPLQIRVSIA